MRKLYLILFALLLACPAAAAEESSARESGVLILVYHRFGARVADSMTVRTAVFAAQLETLRAQGGVVIPLRQWVDYLAGRAPAPPPHAVVITVDDAHKTVFTEMFPLIKRYRIPVTLFIYPSAVSNARYAMTWAQLREMRDSGLVEIQSHTYWHPNFMRERKRLSAKAYEDFVAMQLAKSKAVLAREVGGRVDMLAWPFGLHDDDLERRAQAAGYVAAFTLERRHARRGDDVMALPRYLMTDAVQGRAFARLLAGPGSDGKRPAGGEP